MRRLILAAQTNVPLPKDQFTGGSEPLYQTCGAMPKHLDFEILPQPDEVTCGPTCLHAVYRYMGDEYPLPQIVDDVHALKEGGTLAVLLGCDALRRGYRATVYTLNLSVFDPTWFKGAPSHAQKKSQSASLAQQSSQKLISKLKAQLEVKSSPKLRAASLAYSNFLELGGNLRMQDLNASLLRHYLKRSVPVLTGLSSTYLYQCEREIESNSSPDDIRGVPTGHFVVLCGYDRKERTVRVADPYLPNPLGENHYYDVHLDRLICAILLGVLTYDANLLIIEPKT